MKNIYLYGVLALTITLISWNSSYYPDFVFEKGDQKIELELENKINYLTWNKPARIKLKLQNINQKKLTFSGTGISMLTKESNSSELFIKVTPTKEIFKIDTLNLRVTGRDSKDSIWHHKFVILIKE